MQEELEGAEPGQLIPVIQRDIPCPGASCSARKAREKEEMEWEMFRAVVFVSPMKIVHDGVVLCWEWPNIWDTGNELLALLLCALSCSFTSETIFKPSLSQPCSHVDPSLQGGNATAKPQFQ